MGHFRSLYLIANFQPRHQLFRFMELQIEGHKLFEIANETSTHRGLNLPICKGILYGLGTSFGQHSYANPATIGAVVVHASSSLEGDPKQIVEYPVTKTAYFESEEEPQAFVLIEFPKYEVALSSIVIAYPPLKDCNHIPINLRIEGSNDAVHWKTLHSSYQKDDIKKWPHVMHCAIDNTSGALTAEMTLERSHNEGLSEITETKNHCFYSHIRILHLGKSYPTLSNFFVLSGVEFFGIIRNQSKTIENLEKGDSAVQMDTFSIHGNMKVATIILLIVRQGNVTETTLSDLDKCLNIFDVKNIPVNVIDTNSEIYKEKGDILLGISKTHESPQIFIETVAAQDGQSRTVYFGGYTRLQKLVDNEDIAPHIRPPETFEGIFGHLRSNN